MDEMSRRSSSEAFLPLNYTGDEVNPQGDDPPPFRHREGK
jgi:hypothetical protein